MFVALCILKVYVCVYICVTSTCLHCHQEFFPAIVLMQSAKDRTPAPSGDEPDYSSARSALGSSYTA